MALMCHPAREAFVPELVQALGCDPVVVWDDGSNDRWKTGKRSLLAYDPDAEAHAVIQDDALVCPDLVAGLHLALPHVPQGCPVGLYIGRQKPHRTRVQRAIEAADASGNPWVVYEGPLWGVG